MRAYGWFVQACIVHEGVLVWAVELDSAVAAGGGDGWAKGRIPRPSSASGHGLQLLHQLELLDVELLLPLVLLELIQCSLFVCQGRLLLHGCILEVMLLVVAWRDNSLGGFKVEKLGIQVWARDGIEISRMHPARQIRRRGRARMGRC